jgi:hypothetical protein
VAQCLENVPFDPEVVHDKTDGGVEDWNCVNDEPKAGNASFIK